MASDGALELIRQLLHTVGQLDEPRQALGTVIEVVCDHLVGDVGVLWVHEDGALVPAAVYGADGHRDPATAPPLPEVVAALAVGEVTSAAWRAGMADDAWLAAAGPDAAGVAGAVRSRDLEAVLHVVLTGDRDRVRAAEAVVEVVAGGLGEILSRADAGGQEDLLRASTRTTGSMEYALRAAIAQGAVTVAYQPMVDLDSGVLRGVEALARWTRPDGEVVPPERFIGVAEQAGMIKALGAHVLLTACEDVAAWREAGLVPDQFDLAVNVSAGQLRDPDLLASVDEALARSGIAPRHLTLEVTETAAIETLPQSSAWLEELRQRDIRIAVDDFGTGYSSLSRLQELPADQLKIDRSFLTPVGEDGGDAILGTLCSLGRLMELEIVAEGVETTAQLGAVLDHGCHVAQGFLFSRPLGGADLLRLLADPSSDDHLRPREPAHGPADGEMVPLELDLRDSSDSRA